MKRMKPNTDYNEDSVAFAFSGEVSGCRSWLVRLKPNEMEEWAKRIADLQLIEFVRKINDPDFLPVDEAWRKIYEGWPPVIWLVGREGTRVIYAKYEASIMPEETLADPEGIEEKFRKALGDLAPNELNVTVDDHGIKVRMWWDR